MGVDRGLYFFKKIGFFCKTQYLGFEFFSKNANVVFIENSEFFLKKILKFICDSYSTL